MRLFFCMAQVKYASSFRSCRNLRVPDPMVVKSVPGSRMPCGRGLRKRHGGLPCLRCQRYKRTCHYSQVDKRSEHVVQSNVSRYEVGLCDISLEASNLRVVADMLEGNRSEFHNASISAPNQEDYEDCAIMENYSIHPLSTSTMHYSGEFSHWNYSRMIRRRLQSLGNDPDDNAAGDVAITKDSFRATSLQSTSSLVKSSTTYFPPRHIAEFLTNTFLEYAQTNYFYFDEIVFRQKLDYYYTIERPLDINDAGWICTILMTFAIGTQFAYMNGDRSQALRDPPGENSLLDDNVGLALYRHSCRLIPDLITIASIETVQAFLLLGVYTLPIDTSGLAYTYYGLAINMAIQNGMHRRFAGDGLDARTIEVRNRLWWSAYSLEKRISILHGRPFSVSAAEIDAELPKDLPELRPPNRATNLPNVNATIHLTEQLGKVAHIIGRLRRLPRGLHEPFLEQLFYIHNEIIRWWDSLPEKVHCRDLDPSGPLFRCNIHMEINYSMLRLYMGRPFILIRPTGSPSAGEVDPQRDPGLDITATLSSDGVQAAIRIIELCQLLQDTVGLARISYTEFSSCRAALLAIIAQSLNARPDYLRDALLQGMTLIRQMCVGLESARSEVAVIEALEQAARRLDRRSRSEDTATSHVDSAYSQFQRWARLWQNEPSSLSVMPESQLDDPQITAGSFDGFFASFPQELGSFATLHDAELQFSLNSPSMLWLDNLQLPPSSEDISAPAWEAGSA
ncbi:PrnA-like fungal specific transcription factor, putative [Aspergillus fumigatus A1163]|nr:PrnA-like fungal specific transcription factor, putative [Aspergillus fumigatus A1163]